jgi:predicted HicB family RNase H-like nuclease
MVIDHRNRRMNKKKEQFHLYLPPELKSRLAAAAEQENRSMSNLVVRLIEAACTKAEEQHNKPLEDRKDA